MIKKTIVPAWLAAAAISCTFSQFALAQDAGKVAAEAQPSIKLKDPAAVVNGRTISSAELQQAIEQQLSRSGRTVSDIPADSLLRGYHAVLDDLIIDNLLEEKSKDIKIEDKEVEENFARFQSQFASEDEMKKALEGSGESLDDVRASILSSLKKRAWIIERLGDEAGVADQEVTAFYEKNKDRFAEPEMVRASHILLLTPETLSEDEVAEKKRALDSVKKRIDEGADFAELAKEYSEDPGSKDKGGDLDFFSKERMVPEFSQAAFDAKKGDVVGPVKTQFGWHLIKVTDRKEARTIPMEEAAPQISQYLSSQKQQEKLRQLLTALKQQADVKINLPPLPQEQAPAPTADK